MYQLFQWQMGSNAMHCIVGIIIIIVFPTAYDDAGICIAKVKALSRSLGAFSLSLSSSHAPVLSLVFVLFLGVPVSESIQLLLLFPKFSGSPPDLLISFPKRQ